MPPVVLERPKMSRQMWESLKSHIVRERQRKKQELEADAEVERQRKERERQEKQNSMTLSETREQISALEGRLNELKDEKHQVFLQLKKVLNEDEVRKRQLMSQEQQTSGEIFGVRTIGGNYGPGGMQLPPGPQMLFQQVTLTRPPTGMYKGVTVSHPSQQSSHTLLPPGGMKRSRSPSPPSHQSNNYKFGPFKPPPHAVHSYPHKPGPGVGTLQFFPTQAMPQVSQHSSQPSYSSAHHPPISQSQPPQGTVFTYAGAPPSRSPQAPPQGREEPPKHGTIYLPHQGMPRGYVMHPAVEVRTHTPPPQKFGDDSPKYYPPPPTHSLPIRNSTHMTIHPALSIQAPQGISSGSITSGYPIRTQPSVSSFQGRPPSPHITYSGGPGGPPRLTYGHPGHTAHIQTSSPQQQHAQQQHAQQQHAQQQHAQQQQQQQHQQNAPRYALPPGIQRGERD